MKVICGDFNASVGQADMKMAGVGMHCLGQRKLLGENLSTSARQLHCAS